MIEILSISFKRKTLVTETGGFRYKRDRYNIVITLTIK